MTKQHLTPDGWKRCNAFLKKCKYEKHATLNEVSAFIDSAVKDQQNGNSDAVNNFFDKISELLEKSSLKLESIKEVPVEIEPTYIDEVVQENEEDDDENGLDKVGQGKDGQYEVRCRDRWQHDTPLLHRFGDLIKDKATAEMLHEIDRPKQYQRGWCRLLAEGLLKYNEHVAGYYIFKTEEFPIIGTHHFVQLKDGTYADSLGIWTEEALVSRWKTKDPTAELSSFDPITFPDVEKPNVDITEEDIFPVINELINKHMNGETL